MTSTELLLWILPLWGKNQLSQSNGVVWSFLKILSKLWPFMSCHYLQHLTYAFQFRGWRVCNLLYSFWVSVILKYIFTVILCGSYQTDVCWTVLFFTAIITLRLNSAHKWGSGVHTTTQYSGITSRVTAVQTLAVNHSCHHGGRWLHFSSMKDFGDKCLVSNHLNNLIIQPTTSLTSSVKSDNVCIANTDLDSADEAVATR